MALNEVHNSNFKVYPNPVKDTLFVEGKLNSNSKFELMDSEGKKIQSFDLESNDKTKINISNFPKGIYFYKISENGKLIDSGKIIKN